MSNQKISNEQMYNGCIATSRCRERYQKAYLECMETREELVDEAKEIMHACLVRNLGNGVLVNNLLGNRKFVWCEKDRISTFGEMR